MIKDMTALVRKSNAKKSIVPSWNGGRMPLSANLGMMLRRKLDEASAMVAGAVTGARPLADAGRGKEPEDIELRVLRPLFELQAAPAYMPKESELLIHAVQTKD